MGGRCIDNVLAQAGAFRAGEELNVTRLRSYLAPVLDDPLTELTIRQFHGGFSNLTYLLSSGGTGSEGKKRWVLRRPPFGSQVKSAHDMAREYRVLQALQQVFPLAPTPVHFCADHNVLGCDFYLMSCVEGIIVRKQYPLQLRLQPQQVREQCLAMFDALARLHDIDPHQAGLADFGCPQGYVQRQVDGWSRRYAESATPDAPDFNAVMQWLQDHMPPNSAAGCIIHNDYKLDNVVWCDEASQRIVGVLDWEMATVGDPLMDLGCALSYWAQPGYPECHRRFSSMPVGIAGMPTRAEIVRHFSARTGRSVEGFDFYLCFGLFRLAVIVQQIHYRYRQGLTRDRRFATLIDKINSLQRMCRRVMEYSDL